MNLIRKHLGSREFWKPAIRLGFPVALQNLLVSSFGLVDTLMVGMLGDVPVASVGMAGQWSWLMHLFFYGLSSGAAVFLSQYWGAKDHDGIRRTYGLLAACTLLVTCVMASIAIVLPQFVMGLFTRDALVIDTGASYLRIAGFSYFALAFSQVFSTVLRSTEQVKLPLYASFLGVITNTVLNYGLILGKWGLPEMGIRGAAIATVVAAWVGPILLFSVSLKRRNLLICPIRRLFRFDRTFIKKYFRVSLPVLCNEVIWALGTMGYNMVFGRMGTLQYAALTIFRTVESMFFAFYIGMCHACSVIVGREIGANNVETSVLYANRFTLFFPIVSVGMSVTMIATRGMFLGLFDVSPETVRIAKTIMLIFALEMPIRNISYITICGIFRPGGDTRTGFLYDVIFVWLIALPLTAFCGLVLKLDFLIVYPLMLLSEDIGKSFLCVRRLRSRKWIMPVVETPG